MLPSLLVSNTFTPSKVPTYFPVKVSSFIANGCAMSIYFNHANRAYRRTLFCKGKHIIRKTQRFYAVQKSGQDLFEKKYVDSLHQFFVLLRTRFLRCFFKKRCNIFLKMVFLCVWVKTVTNIWICSLYCSEQVVHRHLILHYAGMNAWFDSEGSDECREKGLSCLCIFLE